VTPWGAVVESVILALQTLGKGTLHDVVEETGLSQEAVRKPLNRMCREPIENRRLHICEWTRVAFHGRVYPRPVYALGAKPNAKKPKPKTHTELAREWARKSQALASAIRFGHVPQKEAIKIVAAARKAGARI
jgi:hypothetical protein